MEQHYKVLPCGAQGLFLLKIFPPFKTQTLLERQALQRPETLHVCTPHRDSHLPYTSLSDKYTGKRNPSLNIKELGYHSICPICSLWRASLLHQPLDECWKPWCGGRRSCWDLKDEGAFIGDPTPTLQSWVCSKCPPLPTHLWWLLHPTPYPYQCHSHLVLEYSFSSWARPWACAH